MNIVSRLRLSSSVSHGSFRCVHCPERPRGAVGLAGWLGPAGRDCSASRTIQTPRRPVEQYVKQCYMLRYSKRGGSARRVSFSAQRCSLLVSYGCHCGRRISSKPLPPPLRRLPLLHVRRSCGGHGGPTCDCGAQGYTARSRWTRRCPGTS